jgi:hypothetical protein
MPTGPTTWIVTINVEDKNGKIKEDPDYTVERTVIGSCADSPSASPLYICAGDTVRWKVKSNHGNDSLGIVQPDKILLDDHGDPSKRFRAENGAQTTGGATKITTPLKSYEYAVTVHDKDNDHLYIDDPKIIIGRK